MSGLWWGVLCGGIPSIAFVGWMIWHDSRHRARMEHSARARRAQLDYINRTLR